MAVSYVGTGSIATGTTSCTVSWPSGHQAGDIALLQIRPDDAATEWPTIPTGWLPVPDHITRTCYMSCSLGMLVYKYATSSSESNVSVSTPTATGCAAAIVVFRGVDPVYPFNAARGGILAGYLVSFPWPDVKIRNNSDDALVFLGNNASDSSSGQWSGASGTGVGSITELYDGGTTNGDGCNIVCFWGRPTADGYVSDFNCSTRPGGYGTAWSLSLSADRNSLEGVFALSNGEYALATGTSNTVTVQAPAGTPLLLEIGYYAASASRTINTPTDATEVAAQQNRPYKIGTTNYYEGTKLCTLEATGDAQDITATISASGSIYIKVFALTKLSSVSVVDYESSVLTAAGDVAYDALDAGRFVYRRGSAFSTAGNIVSDFGTASGFYDFWTYSGYGRAWAASYRWTDTATASDAYTDAVTNETGSYILQVMLDGTLVGGGGSGMFWATNC